MLVNPKEVLHGASSLPQAAVAFAERYGAQLPHARGIAILLPPLTVFTPALDPVTQVVVPLPYFVPLLVQFLDPIIGSVFPRLRGRLAAH